MSYQIALNFEDGVTRFIECGDDELVSDASYRARINIPLDCRDGVCGTCRALVTEGEVDMRRNYALEDDELADGYVLTCQAVPTTDAVTVDYDD